MVTATNRARLLLAIAATTVAVVAALTLLLERASW